MVMVGMCHKTLLHLGMTSGMMTTVKCTNNMNANIAIGLEAVEDGCLVQSVPLYFKSPEQTRMCAQLTWVSNDTRMH